MIDEPYTTWDNPNLSPQSKSRSFNQKSTKNDQKWIFRFTFSSHDFKPTNPCQHSEPMGPMPNNKNHRIFHVNYERSAYIFNMRARLYPSKLESEYGLSINYPTKINNKPNTKATKISTSFSHEDLLLSTNLTWRQQYSKYGPHWGPCKTIKLNEF